LHMYLELVVQGSYSMGAAAAGFRWWLVAADSAMESV
jgi:hypothetical protein